MFDFSEGRSLNTGGLCASNTTVLLSGLQVITVVNNNDSGAGSLRQALLDAAVGEEIQFSVAGIITLANELTISQDVLITGPGTGVLTIDANSTSRHFDVQNVVVTISGLTLVNGSAVNGAAIINVGNLTLDSLVIHDCETIGNGGAIHNSATLIVSNTNIHTNLATNNGGGIFNSGTATLTNCVITLNTVSLFSGEGGGVFNSTGGNIEINDCSISANESDTDGFQIYNEGTLTLTRSTVFDGGASTAGVAAIYNDTGTVYIQNSTLSNNLGMTAVYNDQGSVNFTNSTVAYNGIGLLQTPGSITNIYNTILAGNVTTDYQGDTADIISGGHNLFGNSTNYITPGTRDWFGLDFAALNIGLLADNGGPTLTHRLLPGSPAINNGNNTSAPGTDQRGNARIVGNTIDIGAYEVDCMTFTGTLPAGITRVGDCLVIAADQFEGSTQEEADALAQAALDAYVAAEQNAGRLICLSGAPGPDPPAPPEPPSSPISFVGFTLGPTQNVGTTIGLQRTIGLGNLVIVGVACVNAPVAITVTDSTGNAYTPIIPAQTAFYTAQLFYCSNVIGNINTIITAHVDTAVQQSIGVWEFAGGTQGLDGFANANAASGLAITGDVTISQAICALVFLISANVAPGSESTAQAGWTLDAASGAWGAAFAHRITSLVGPYHGEGTHVNSSEWAASFAAFT